MPPYKWTFVAVIGALLASSANARENPKSEMAIDVLTRIGAEMGSAKATGDWPAYLSAAKRQMEFLNGSPLSHLEVARAQAHLNDVNAALKELRDFANMGQAPTFLDALPDLAPLRETAEFAAIRQRAADNLRPITRATPAFHLKERNLLPEDIDYDSATQRFFISSVLQKKIVTATMQGDDIRDFASSPDRWPVFALKIDRARELVWATEVAVEGFADTEPAARGRSALLCYDLRSGRLLRRIEAPRPTALGDITLLADGSIIASDGEHGGVYRLRPTDDHLERLDAGDFISPQTVAAAADDAHIIVPDYVRGLGLLSLETKRVTWLPTRRRLALDGIDGLYRVGDRLLAIQNGAQPGRVVLFSMSGRGEEIIERATPTLRSPTHGVIVDDTFYYIANSGWDVLDESGKLKPGMAFTEPLVMKARSTQRSAAAYSP